jgi:Flp pilus assembly CpaE family ATPase
VRAANEGRTVIEMFPKESVTADFDVLADRVLGTPRTVPSVRSGFRFAVRGKEPARA